MSDSWSDRHNGGLILQTAKSVDSFKIITPRNSLTKISQKNSSTLTTIPTEKDKLIADLNTGDCLDATGNAQIRFALEKQIFFYPSSNYFTGIISQDWK